MKYDEYRKFKMAVRLSVPHDVAADMLGKFDDLRDLIWAIRSNAQYIVETQTEMHPAHRALVQQIVDATRQVEFEQDVKSDVPLPPDPNITPPAYKGNWPKD